MNGRVEVPQRRLIAAIVCGGVIVWLAVGTRQSFGLFLQPITSDLGWGRELFAFSLALQNLMWGLAQPFAGMVADRYGSGRVLVMGAAVYIAGLALMSQTAAPWHFHLGAGVLIGLALAATSFAVVLSAVGRLVAPERRGLAFGIVTAIGSFGQFAMVPTGQAFLAGYGWSTAFLLLAVCAVMMAPLALALRGRQPAAPGSSNQNLREALAEAARHSGFRYLTLGFFVCGFQVTFIAVHLPASLADSGIATSVAAWALSLIGLFNVVGSLGCGILGDRFSKKYLLSLLYLARAVAIVVFLTMPLGTVSVLVFASVMGLLWLGTVPLTSGLVAQIFGARHMGTLFGIVFLSHQLGSFLGIWLGGLLFDATGSYAPVWWTAVVLGLVAAILHWPINDRPVARLAMALD